MLIVRNNLRKNFCFFYICKHLNSEKFIYIENNNSSFLTHVTQ